MKHILTIILSFFYLLSYSQNNGQPNGGQWPENNALKIEYLGYSNGIHIVKLNNKQTCDVNVKTKVLGKNDNIVQILALSYININIFEDPGVEVTFKAKTETACTQETDMGWVENKLPGGTLNLIENNNVSIIRNGNKLELSLNSGVLNTNYGNMNFFQHIKIYNLSGITIFNNSSYIKKSNQINLNNYLQKGINLIEVIIDNKKIDRFLFRYIK